ncbi:uncharacterized protein LOC114287860 [Camellia sinensis]|uniref:uncharacterized protein LOC114287860 n=1 Tax=Camellia sinensis TaxID=4442 RepID=UPI001036AF4F|nr:uncharacterized protein LOC114287860 [Camellia sinensis]
MDACHVENQQTGQYNEVRMSNLESDIRELKEMMKQVLHNQTDLMEMLRHFEGKQVVRNDKVEGNDVCIINLSSNVAQLKDMLKQLLQRFSLGCNEPFTEQTNLRELKQMLHHLIEGIFSTPQPAGVAKQGVDPAVGVEAHEDGVVKPSDEVNPMECNISDVQGVDHQQHILKGTLARDKSHLHDGHKLNIEEGGDNNKKGGLQSGETYETEDKYSPDLQSVGVKNVACDVHTSPTKLGKPLGATVIVRGSAKGRRKGKGKGKMCESGVQATEVGDMQLCIDSKTNSGVDDSSSPMDVDGVDNVNKDSLTMLDSEGLLSAEEQKLLHYVFDDSKNEMDIVVSMNLHGRACEVGTRRDMRTLKPGSWLSDTPINLVVVQLTNRQRDLHNDGRHTDWFFPVYLL